jgi:hypothetical protein
MSEAEIAQSVQRRATGWTGVVLFRVGERDISLPHSVQAGFGAHPASYPNPTVKRQGREADQSPPSSVVVKKDGAILLLAHTSAWHGP